MGIICYIQYTNLISDKFREIVKDKCDKYKYSFYEGGLIGLDNPHCYEEKNGVRREYYLMAACLKLNLQLNNKYCYLYEP